MNKKISQNGIRNQCNANHRVRQKCLGLHCSRIILFLRSILVEEFQFCLRSGISEMYQTILAIFAILRLFPSRSLRSIRAFWDRSHLQSPVLVAGLAAGDDAGRSRTPCFLPGDRFSSVSGTGNERRSPVLAMAVVVKRSDGAAALQERRAVTRTATIVDAIGVVMMVVMNASRQLRSSELSQQR